MAEPNQIFDDLELIEFNAADESWEGVIQKFEHEATMHMKVANEALAKIADLEEQAEHHDSQYREFKNLANAMRNAPVTFATNTTGGE